MGTRTFTWDPAALVRASDTLRGLRISDVERKRRVGLWEQLDTGMGPDDERKAKP